MTNKTITLARERAAFEALVQEKSERFQPDFRRLGEHPEAEYKCANNQWAWELWQARAALAEPVPPACCTCGKPTACGKMICEECCYEPLPVPPAGDWAIDTTAGRPILVYQGCSVIEAEQAYYVLGLLNGTVPPAGGEPESQQYVLRAMTHNYRNGHSWDHLDGEVVRKAADEITRLQAEVERLKEGKALVEIAASQVVKAKESLQSELTKARELLQMVLDTYGYGLREIDYANVKTFLAHQSAPDDKGKGEPVAEIVSKFGDPEAFGERELIALKDISRFPYGTKLYAEQPAPVAVVHPFAEKVISKLRRCKECAEDFESGGADIGRHWFDILTHLGLLSRVQRSPAMWEMTQQGEDCLEEVARLNGVKS